MSGLARLAVIAGGLLLLALGPRVAEAQTQTKRSGSKLQTFYLRTAQGWKPFVGIPVLAPSALRDEAAGIRVPLRLPHGLGEVGNLPKRLPHGLGEVGNLPKRLPHGLPKEIGRLPLRLPHGLPKEIGDLPVQLQAPAVPLLPPIR